MDQRRRFYIIFTAIIFVLIIFAIYLSQDFISTILLSFLLAYILDPVFMYFSRNVGHHRRASALASILIIFFILIFVIFAAADALITEMSNLLGLGGVAYLQIQASNFSGTINSLSEMYLPALAANYVKGIGDIPTALILMVQPVLQDNIISFASNLPIYFTQFLLAIFFTYYFLVDGRRIINEFVGLLPEKEVSTHFLLELNLIYKSLFRVFFLTSLLIGIIGAIRVPRARHTLSFILGYGNSCSRPGSIDRTRNDLRAYCPLLSADSRLYHGPSPIGLRSNLPHSNP